MRQIKVRRLLLSVSKPIHSMTKQPLTLVVVILAAFAATSLHSCRHEPLIPPVTPPVDTTGSGTTTGQPCSPDTVYFEQQILPILQSNCAMSGCHDAASAQDGVVLTDYASVMNTADVRPFNLGGSDLYEVITETDPDKMMPPPPSARLSSAQVALIATWINQGAQNLSCDASAGGCDTLNMSFSNDIVPILNNKCVGCHNGPSGSGGVDLSTYNGVLGVVQSGQLFGSINWDNAYSNMPKGGSQLPSCEINQIKAWIDAGALNN